MAGRVPTVKSARIRASAAESARRLAWVAAPLRRAARALGERQLGRRHDLAPGAHGHEARQEPRVGVGLHRVGDQRARKSGLVFGEMDGRGVEVRDIERCAPAGRRVAQLLPSERQAGCSASTATVALCGVDPVAGRGGAGVPLKAAR